MLAWTTAPHRWTAFVAATVMLSLPISGLTLAHAESSLAPVPGMTSPVSTTTETTVPEPSTAPYRYEILPVRPSPNYQAITTTSPDAVTKSASKRVTTPSMVVKTATTQTKPASTVSKPVSATIATKPAPTKHTAPVTATLIVSAKPASAKTRATNPATTPKVATVKPASATTPSAKPATKTDKPVVVTKPAVVASKPLTSPTKTTTIVPAKPVISATPTAPAKQPIAAPAVEDTTPTVTQTFTTSRQATDKGATVAANEANWRIAGTGANPLVYLPLDLTGYVGVQPIPTGFNTAAEVMALLKDNNTVALQFEVVRRGYWSLPTTEQKKLITALQTYHQQNNTDPYRFFALGIAKVMYEDNQSGLFYLRKANDSIQSAYTHLIYGLAQAGVDLRQEASGDAQRTLRKQDAMFLLSDSVRAHHRKNQPGFWTAFLRTADLLAPLPAYTEHVTTDMSDLVVPYGDRVEVAYVNPGDNDTLLAQAKRLPNDDSVESTALAATEIAPLTPTTCTRPQLDAATPKTASRTVYVQADGQQAYETIYVTANSPDATTPQTLWVTQQNQVLGQFNAEKAPYVFEDLNSDGVPEIVLRQFSANKAEPVRVYRYTGCQYELDKTIASQFE